MSTTRTASEAPGELLPSPRWAFHGAVAIRKANTPGWTPFKIETVGTTQDALLKGGVEATGRNGKPKWLKPHTQVVVTHEEVEAEAGRYEREHARCRDCFGRGTELISISVANGCRYVRCHRCKGSGRPNSPAVSP